MMQFTGVQSTVSQNQQQMEMLFIKKMKLLTLRFFFGCVLFLVMITSWNYQLTAIPSKGEHNDKFDRLGLQIPTDRKCTNEHRQHYISNMCSSETGPLPSGNATFVVDEKNELLMCEISKSGCTTWKALWVHSKANIGANLTKIPIKYGGNKIHLLSFMAQYGLQLVLDEIPEKFQNFTKFLIVRNPFDRIVSAYYNLVYWKPGLGDAEKEVVQDIKTQFQKNSLESLTFTQFVEYITNRNSKYYHDKHWDQYSRICQPCAVHYDYIIRLESMNNYPENKDAQPVMTILGYDESMLKTFQKAQQNNATRKDQQLKQTIYSKQLPIFKELPLYLFNKILHKYRLDLKLFGYSFDGLTYTTNCDIGYANDSCC